MLKPTTVIIIIVDIIGIAINLWFLTWGKSGPIVLLPIAAIFFFSLSLIGGYYRLKDELRGDK